jgi:hypothetical protein
MTWRPRRWSRTTWSSTGMNAWCGHSPHLTFGFSQTPGFHSLAQAGAHPFVREMKNPRRIGGLVLQLERENMTLFDDEARALDWLASQQRRALFSLARSRSVSRSVAAGGGVTRFQAARPDEQRIHVGPLCRAVADAPGKQAPADQRTATCLTSTSRS